jgi:hypothetical protein
MKFVIFFFALCLHPDISFHVHRFILGGFPRCFDCFKGLEDAIFFFFCLVHINIQN